MSTQPLTSGPDTLSGGNQVDDRFEATASSDLDATDTIFGGTQSGPFDPGDRPTLTELHGDVIDIAIAAGKTTTILDNQLTGVSDVETLAVEGRVAFTVSLGRESDEAGIAFVDASLATGNVSVDATQRQAGIEVDFTSKGLTAGDSVKGALFSDDAIGIVDKAAVADSAFSKISNVRTVIVRGDPSIADYSGAKIQLGALAVKAGIDTVENRTDYGLMVDASRLPNAGAVVFEGSIGDDVLISDAVSNIFHGGGGNDTLKLALAQLAFDPTFAGGAGTDEVHILDAQNAKSPIAILDSDFAGFTSVERLVFDASGKQVVTLGAGASAAGLNTVDASKESAGLTLDAGATTSGITVIAGRGADHVTFSNTVGGTLQIISKNLTAADSVTGGVASRMEFTDAVKLSDSYFGALATNVTDVVDLVLDNAAKGQSVIAGTKFDAFAANAGLVVLETGSFDPSTSLTFDFSKSGRGLIVDGSQGNDVFLGNATTNHKFFGLDGNDSFRFGSDGIGGQVNGGDGTDELVVLDAANPILDSYFAHVSLVEALRLGATKTGPYSVTLGADATTAGIGTVDASGAGVDVSVNASGESQDLILIAGTKSNQLTGGDGNDVFRIDARSFGSGDAFVGGLGNNSLAFTTNGTVGKGADLTDINTITFSDKGNSLDFKNLGAFTVSNTAVAHVNGTTLTGFDLVVQGGAGTDTFIGSGTAPGTFAFVAGAGNDSVTGFSGVSNFYIFSNPGDLTASDKVIGSVSGTDTVVLGAGTYAASLFKGFVEIDQIAVIDADPTKGSVFTLADSVFTKGAASQIASGQKALDFSIDNTGNDTIDAGAVKGAFNFVTANTGGGEDTLIGGAGNDLFTFNQNGTGFELDSGDVVHGGGGFDVIALASDLSGAATLQDSDLLGLSSVEGLSANGIGNFTLALGENAESAGLFAISSAGNTLDLDASHYTDSGRNFLDGITISLGVGNNTLTLSGADDTVDVFDNATLDANDTIDGGSSNPFSSSVGAEGDAIVFHGSAAITDSQFTHVSNVPTVKLADQATQITLGSAANSAAIQRVDASQAEAGVAINASADNHGLLLIGSAHRDSIIGSKGDDVILGGGEGGNLDGTTSGADTFVFLSSGDSGIRANGNLFNITTIANFGADDVIDLGAFDFTSDTSNVKNYGSASLPTVDTANFYDGEAVAVMFDGGVGGTILFADTNNNGTLDLGSDLIVRVDGVVSTDLTSTFLKDASQLIFGNGPVTFLDLPTPARQSIVSDTPLDVTAPNTLDDTFFGPKVGDSVVVTGGKGAFSLKLGANSEDAGVQLVDASLATGTVTVDGSQRLLGFAVQSGTGINILTGSRNDDTFIFTNKGLAASDTVNGGGIGDHDRILITDKAALTDAALAKVSNLEILEFGSLSLNLIPDMTGQKVTLGKNSDAAGITTVINDYAQGLTVDASQRKDKLTVVGGEGDDVLIASQTGLDKFEAGAGDDSLHVKSTTISSGTFYFGGSGTDEIQFLDAGGVNDGDFLNMASVERLVLEATGKQSVQLSNEADGAGIAVIDASKVRSGLTFDSTGMTHAIDLSLGTGSDSVTLGAQDARIFMASRSLTKTDILVGQAGHDVQLHFTDAVRLTDKVFAGLDVENFSSLVFDNVGKGQSLVAGATFTQFIAGSSITSVAASESNTAGFLFDFSGYTGPSNVLTLMGGAGNDVFKQGQSQLLLNGGEGDDSFQFASASFGGTTVTAGAGRDEIVILDAGTAINNIDFFHVSDVETLRLGATKAGSYSVTLGAFSDAAGIVTVDASGAGVNVVVNAAAAGNDMKFIAGLKDDSYTGGAGNDTFVFDPKALNAKDTVIGGSSTDGDTLQFSRSGVVAATAFDGVSGIEFLQLSDLGNTVALSQFLVDGSDDQAKVVAGSSSLKFDFAVLGSNHNDVVDLTQLGSEHVAVVANGGNDRFTGGAADDFFYFTQSGDLTSADIVKGGGGIDALVLGSGVHGLDTFKGVSGVERILVENTPGATSGSVALNNALFSGIDADSQGNHVLSIQFDTTDNTVDGSAITNATDSLFIFANVGAETFIGGAGADTFKFSSAIGELEIGADDSLNGGGGRDTLEIDIFDSSLHLDDTALQHVTSVETVLVQGQAGNDFAATLGSFAEGAGIDTFDASGVSGNLTLDATAFKSDLLVVAGQGTADNIQLGAGDDTVRYIFGELDSTDTLDGGAHGDKGDTLEFVGDHTIVDAAFTDVTNFQNLVLTRGDFGTVTLGSHAVAAGFQFVDAGGAYSGVTLNAASFDSTLSVNGSNYGDVIVTGKSDDTLWGGLGNDMLSGGAGNDVLNGGLGGDSLTGGANADTFEYRSAAESHLGSANGLENVDTIQDFNLGQGDVIDLFAFGNKLDKSTASLANAADFDTLAAEAATAFNGHAGTVAVGQDTVNNLTYLFADTDQSGTLTSDDLVVKLVGLHGADLTGGGVHFAPNP